MNRIHIKQYSWTSILQLSLVISCLDILAINSRLLAQIIPDATLGAEKSRVTSNQEINGINSTLIEGGAIRDSNLFHSFQEFNIDEGRGAYFSNPAAVQNIFSRVTGGNISEIFGTLGVLGNANLFFLNPNGILFGANASLDLQGSFLGTSGDRLFFENGWQFSASNPETPPLLTINMPIGLGFLDNQRSKVENAGNLTVGFGQGITLAGNQVTSTGNLTAPGGRVELLGTESVALLGNATIDVSSPTRGGTVLIGGDFQGLGTVPNAQRTYVSDKVTINADALTSGNGGKVIVWADEVTGFYGNISAKGGVESGNGGLVEVSGKEHLIFRGNVNTNALNGLPGNLLLDPTNIIIANGNGDEAGDENNSFAGNNSGVEGSILSKPLSEINDIAPTTIYESELEGLSGDTNIVLQATNDIRLQDLSDDGLTLPAGEGIITLSADADRNGVGDFIMEDNVADIIFTNGRNITISGANLELGNIDTSQQIGNSGSIDFNAIGDININGLVDTSVNLGEGGAVKITAGSLDLTNGAQIKSTLAGEGEGNAGAITIETKFLSLNDGARLNTTTSGVGNAGSIEIKATDSITLKGENSRGLGSGIFSDVNSDAQGTTEGISIDTGSLSILDGGQISVSTGGVGDGEAIIINAKDTITIEGTSSQGRNSRIINAVAPGAKGNVKGIIIDTASLFIINGGQISSSTFALGDPGAVTIKSTNGISIEGGAILSQVLPGGRGTAGGININTDSLSLKDGAIASQVAPGARGTAGVITIDSSYFSLTDGGIVTSGSFGVGDAGKIIITATDAITLEGKGSRGLPSSIFSQINPEAEGTGGSISINTSSLSLKDGAVVSASTGGVGDAGAISITATDFITLEGEDQGFPSGIFSTVVLGAEGKAGNITLNTSSLSVTDGAQISTSTFGVGDAGKITITATDTITLEEEKSFRSGIFSGVAPGAQGNSQVIMLITDSLFVTGGARVSARTSGQGKAGNIVITANTLEATNGGQIQTNTTTNSDAADITLTINDNLLLSGIDSGLFAQTEGGGTSGNVNITASDIFINDNGAINVSATATGEAGSVNINAQDITIDNASLTAETRTGDQGNITIDKADTLLLRNNSEITTNATEQATGGDITLTSDVIALQNNSNITANAIEGRGGNILITTQGLFQDLDSEITAASELGIDGTISINTPDVDPASGLVELPDVPVDVSALLARNICDIGRGKTGNNSSFINTGRGGLPPNPYEPLQSNNIFVDVQLPTEWREKPTTNSSISETATKPIVEASSWVVNEKGNVELVSQIPSKNLGCK